MRFVIGPWLIRTRYETGISTMALKASERATLMKEIAKRLSEESWAFVDATLNAFKLPMQASWNGTSESYAVKMVEDASDEQLLELAEHVGFKFEANPKPLRVDPPFWRKDMFRLFISHLAVHRDDAAKLQAALEPFGISSFVAHNDIEPTLEWQNEIETA